MNTYTLEDVTGKAVYSVDAPSAKEAAAIISREYGKQWIDPSELVKTKSYADSAEAKKYRAKQRARQT